MNNDDMQWLRKLSSFVFHTKRFYAVRFALVLALSLSVTFSLGFISPTSVKANPDLDYNIKLSHQTSWAGNTYGYGRYDDGQQIQNWIEALWVGSNGTVYGTCFYDETNRDTGVYGLRSDGSYGRVGANNGSLGGRDSDADGTSIAGNDTYVWVSIKNGQVRRYNRGNNAQDGSDFSVSSAAVKGMVVSGSELFASDNAGGLIKVYNLSGGFLRQWSLPRSGPLAVDGAGNLWILQYGDASNPTRIVKYNKSGVSQSVTISLSTTSKPVALTWNGSANRLMVADNGTDQNIKYYDVGNLTGNPTTLASQFGAVGGVYSGSRAGQVGPLRFHDLSGVGVDSSGNIYVSHGDRYITPNLEENGGTELESYTASGTRRWILQGLEFTDVASFDPVSDGADLYTKDTHYRMDWSKPAGQQWTEVGWTMNPSRFPHDPRRINHSYLNHLERINGNLLMATSDMYSDHFAVYRFESSTETAVPTMVIRLRGGSQNGLWPNAPSAGWWWKDNDNDGQMDADEYQTIASTGGQEAFWMDRNGTIWVAGGNYIRSYLLQGFDAQGKPNYAIGPVTDMGERVVRAQYIAAQDTMYLSIGDRPNIFKDLGARLVRINNWSSGNRTPAWTKTLSTNYNGKWPGSMYVEGNYIFMARYTTEALLPGQGKAGVEVYSIQNGAYVGYMEPGSEIGGTAGAVDMVHSLSGFKRANGEYVVAVEDDIFGKIVLYRWCPSGSCTGSTGIQAKRVTTAPTIDGNLNESSWSVTTSVSKTTIGAPNNTTTAGLLWDNTYLYVGVRVLDANLYNDSANIWDDDGVEIYIDGNNNKGTTYDSFDRQYIKAYNDTSLFAQGNATGVIHNVTSITGGYSIEVAIPWSNLGLTPNQGLTIGFDVGNNDDDNGTGRDHQAVWQGTVNNFSNTSAFGTVTLAP